MPVTMRIGDHLHRVRTDASGRPQSTSFRMYRCAMCPHIHVALRDENGDVFAQMVIDNDQAMRIGREGETPSVEEGLVK